MGLCNVAPPKTVQPRANVRFAGALAPAPQVCIAYRTVLEEKPKYIQSIIPSLFISTFVSFPFICFSFQ
jgi:hypothetical protein